jgi:hypothetical protein
MAETSGPRRRASPPSGVLGAASGDVAADPAPGEVGQVGLGAVAAVVGNNLRSLHEMMRPIVRPRIFTICVGINNSLIRNHIT